MSCAGRFVNPCLSIVNFPLRNRETAHPTLHHLLRYSLNVRP